MGRLGAFMRAAGTAQARAFGADRSGNVAILWALMGAILIGMVGLTVDFTRAQMIRAELQNAADGAALIAERSSNLPLAQRQTLARAFFDTEAGEYSSVQSFQVLELESGGHRVEITYLMDTSLARVVKNEDWTINVAAEAEARASPPIEVVLVLDNTYSMVNDIDDLRDAAESLAEFLFSIDGDTVSVALVPFEAYVNIGNNASHMAWMDTTGIAPYNGEMLEDRQITRTNTSNRKSSGNCNHLSTTVGSSPYPITWVKSGSRCYGYNPSTINYFDLFDQIPNASWKGCVEARPEPYDIQDDAPSSGTPATLFVPFFYLDDDDNTNGAPNDGLSDNTLPTGSLRTAGRTLSVFKYDGSNGSLNETHTTTGSRGPNRGCPTPIVPLTTDEDDILDGIDDMRVWFGGGTNSAEGLAWGWRVLSPGAPFTEGRPYDDPDDPVRKVIVLMTDGENTNINATSEDDMLESYNNAYGYRGQWTNYEDDMPAQYRRDIDDSESSYVAYVNARQAQLCTNIKAEDIEIYTVAFRNPGSTIETLLSNCATGNDHYFNAENATELQEAFDAIGSGIGQLRITN